MIFEQQSYKAGIYLRLSRDDDLQGESGSISTQRTLLTQYCKENNFKIADEYCDDGWSGTNFDRPDFQRMIGDIHDRKINLVITKDLSRFGRDYIQSGYYIEKIFQKYNVRYIAVGDNVDTLKGNDDILMPIKNVINDLYAKDISRKVRSAFNAKAKEGQYVASKPPLGYKKSPDDKHKLIIDDEGAEIVRKIFRMASKGYGYNKMTRELEGTPNPITYFMLKNPDYYDNPRWKPNYTWNNKSIRVILDNMVYLGKIVYGRTRAVSVSSKNVSRRPKDEWIVAHDTHEPIISQELWDKAHAMLSVRRKETKNKEPHIFAGLIKCMDCGYALLYHDRQISEKTRGEFKCCKYSRQGKESCTSHYITYPKVYEAVLNSVKKLAREACSDEGKLLKSLEKESLSLFSEHSKKAEKERIQLENRVGALDLIIKKLYEDSVLGKLSSERFEAMMSDYENEQSELKERLSVLNEQKEKQDMMTSQLDSFIDIIKRVKDIQKLDAVIVNQLISRIEVGQIHKNLESGRKEQQIKITYKFCPVSMDCKV